MNKFDITSTYANGKEYVYEPSERNQNQSFSIGLLPIYGFGWKVKPTFTLPCFTDSEPNEPTVLDCKDKMMNEI